MLKIYLTYWGFAKCIFLCLIILKSYNFELFVLSFWAGPPNFLYYSRNISFITIAVFIVSKISTSYIINCRKYWKKVEWKLYKNYIYYYYQLFLFLLQQFQYIHQLIYLLTFSCIYNFHNLSAHQHHMTYHIHTCNY